MTNWLRATQAADLERFKRASITRFAARAARDDGPTDVAFERLATALDRVYSVDMLERSVSFVAEDDGGMLAGIMATEIQNSIDGAREGLIHTIFVDTERVGSTLGRELAVATEEAAVARDWRFLRARIPVQGPAPDDLFPLECGWEPMGFTVVKPPARVDLHDIPGITIRSASRDDIDFVTDLLVEGLWLGLREMERSLFSRVQIQHAANALLASVVGPGMAILIAESDGKRIGHATGNVAVEHETTGQIEAVLHDVFVLEEYRSRGVSTLLAQIFEHLAVRAGRSVLRGTVSGPTNAAMQRVLDQIAPLGYCPDERLLCRPIAQRVST